MKHFKRKAQDFLLVWSHFGSQLIKQLSDRKSVCLTFVNMIRLFIDEYIMVAIETQMHHNAQQVLLSKLRPYWNLAGKCIHYNSSVQTAILS